MLLLAELFHPLAARVTIGLFLLIWGSSVAAGLLAEPALLAVVKEGVVWAVFLLIPAMMVTAGTGLVLTRVRPGPVVARKRRRLRLITAIGVLILLPAALGLDALAHQGGYDQTLFLTVQGLELVAGLVTLGLMAISVRDGIVAKREAAAIAAASPPAADAVSP